MSRLLYHATQVLPTAPAWTKLVNAAGWTSNTLRGMYYNGNTYFGFIDLDGNVRVSSYNHTTHAVATSPVILSYSSDIDHHGSPAVIVRNSDHKLVVASADHSSTSLSIAISTNAEDVSAWGAATNIDSTLGGTQYTYCNLFQLSGESNKLYLFYRDYDGVSTGTLAYSTSTDGGATWAAQTVLFSVSTKVVYSAIGSDDTSRIDLLVTDGDAQDGNTASLYHFYYAGSGTFKKSDGTTISVSKPYGTSDVTKVHDGATLGSIGTTPTAIVTNGGNPIGCWPAYNTAGAGSNANNFYGTCSAGTWTVNTIADSGLPPADPYYNQGPTLDRIDPTIVYLSRYVSGVWQIVKYQTANGGTSWSSTQLTTDTGVEGNINPASIANSNSGMRVMWMYGQLFATIANPTFSASIRGYPAP